MSLDWGVVLGLVINFAAVAYTAGTTITRLAIVEKELAKIDTDIRDFRALKEDLAVMKSQLLSINDLLHQYVKNEAGRS